MTHKKLEVQVGFCGGAYKPRYTFGPDELRKAVMYYEGINIGRGYKKRFVVDGKVTRRMLPDNAYCPRRR